MFKTILVGSDGSDSALQAAGMAAQLALKFGSELILLNVFDPSTMMPSTLGVWDAGIASEAFVQYASDIQRAAERNTGAVFEQAGVPYLPLREMGHPVEILVSVAERKQADLIVLGSRGLSAWKALLLGSVSEGVLHHAICHVLIACGDSARFDTILLASDGSHGASKAAQLAAGLAEKFASTLKVLNVFRPLHTYQDIPTAGLDRDAYARFMLQAVAKNVEHDMDQNHIAYTLHQRTGDPAEQIVCYADEINADLVVLGSRGLGTFKSLLLGSVSDQVTHHAHRSVLIAR